MSITKLSRVDFMKPIQIGGPVQTSASEVGAGTPCTILADEESRIVHISPNRGKTVLVPFENVACMVPVLTVQKK